MQLKAWCKDQIKAGRVERVVRIARTVQKGARTLQFACGDAKSRKLGAVAKLVPGVKRSVEQFTLTVRALLNGSGGVAAVKVGNLKHRNLKGDVVGPVDESEPEASAEEEDDEEEGGAGSADTPSTRASGKQPSDAMGSC